MFDTNRPRQVDGYQMADKETVDGELVLFHPATQKILYSNRTGALIWGLCDGQRTVADIVEILDEAYPEASAEIADDVQITLQTFAENGAIEWV